MKEEIQKYLEYLRNVKNSSPHTLSNYGNDLRQFLVFLSPPGSAPPALRAVKHGLIREFISHLHDHGLKREEMAGTLPLSAFRQESLRQPKHKKTRDRRSQPKKGCSCAATARCLNFFMPPGCASAN